MNRITTRLHLDRGDFRLDVDLSLPGQGISALFGHSGSGKTTCLRAIAGLERLPGGQVKVGDQIWQDEQRGLFVPPHQRPIGYVFQEASLFPHLSVRQNLNFGLKRLPREARRGDLETMAELLGIRPLLDRPADVLSGGERQRAAIARALLTAPQLLLMDEPLAALDLKRKQEILPYLERLHEELSIPIIYVSHAPDEVARLADHLVLLDQGRVVASGPLTETLASGRPGWRATPPMASPDWRLPVANCGSQRAASPWAAGCAAASMPGMSASACAGPPTPASSTCCRPGWWHWRLPTPRATCWCGWTWLAARCWRGSRNAPPASCN